MGKLEKKRILTYLRKTSSIKRPCSIDRKQNRQKITKTRFSCKFCTRKQGLMRFWDFGEEILWKLVNEFLNSMELAKFRTGVHQSLIGHNSRECLFSWGFSSVFWGLHFLGNFSIFDFLVDAIQSKVTLNLGPIFGFLVEGLPGHDHPQT